MATKNPSLKLDPSSGIPLYIQIKQQLGSLISAKILEPGLKLPTERELAQVLKVSRNTVSAAYKELQADGLLVSLQGKGTFVAEGKKEKDEFGRKERLLKVIDLALEEAAKLEFSPDDFLTLATTRALERKEALEIIDVAFITNSLEQAFYFQHELVSETGVRISPFLLREVKRDPVTAKERLHNFDLIATTFLDVDELQTLIKLPHIPTLGIVLELELETVVRVARLAQNSILAVVCSTDAFATTVKQSFCKSGIDNLDFIFTTASGEQLAKIIAQCDAVAVSAERTTEMLGWIQEGVQIEIIKLKYRIDQGSLNMLRCYLADLRNQT